MNHQKLYMFSAHSILNCAKNKETLLCGFVKNDAVAKLVLPKELITISS